LDFFEIFLVDGKLEGLSNKPLTQDSDTFFTSYGVLFFPFQISATTMAPESIQNCQILPKVN
jgi:hypothetical protein